MNQLNRLETDVLLYFYPPEWYKTVLHDPIPGTRVINDFTNLIEAFGKYAMGEDEIQYGPYAGQSRTFRNTIKLIPGPSQVQRFIDAGKQVYY